MSNNSLVFNYNSKYKSNQIIKGTGRVCVVTGWAIKSVIEHRVNRFEYASIGNLYSPSRGINFLVRNILLNPHISHIVIMESTKEDKNSGSSRCLFDLFLNGVTKCVNSDGSASWKVSSNIDGFIDIDVSLDSINHIREYIIPVLVDSAGKAVNAIKQFASDSCSIPLRTSHMFPHLLREFPLSAVESITKPSRLCGHIITGKTIAESWVKIIHKIRTSGVIRAHGHDGQWQELIDLMVVVTDEPRDFYFPEPNYLPVDRDFISKYVVGMIYDSERNESVKYTYGQRMRSWFEGKDQIELVISKLRSDRDSASAVINLWDVNDHLVGGSPCLNHIWFRVNEVKGTQKLSMTATFRSNDMFSAWVSNAMGLRALQQLVLDGINRPESGGDADNEDQRITIGDLITISQSAHIYDDCWENADSLIKNEYAQICSKIDYYDPVGNFLIEVDEFKSIIVTHTDPSNGCVVATYNGKNPLKLIRSICNDNPSIKPDHAGYIGIELNKAIHCAKSMIQYNQDC
jgi:thymidylate synthase